MAGGEERHGPSVHRLLQAWRESWNKPEPPGNKRSMVTLVCSRAEERSGANEILKEEPDRVVEGENWGWRKRGIQRDGAGAGSCCF